jgi:hypothetical protein
MCGSVQWPRAHSIPPLRAVKPLASWRKSVPRLQRASQGASNPEDRSGTSRKLRRNCSDATVRAGPPPKGRTGTLARGETSLVLPNQTTSGAATMLARCGKQRRVRRQSLRQNKGKCLEKTNLDYSHKRHQGAKLNASPLCTHSLLPVTGKGHRGAQNG